MATALKRTIIVLSVLLGLELVAASYVVSGGHDAYAASESPVSMLTMDVSDVAYKAPIGIGITSKKATAETIAELKKTAKEQEDTNEGTNTAWAEETVVDEEATVEAGTNWQEQEADYAYDEATDYDSCDANDGGSGDVVCDEYVNANIDGAWIAGADFMFNGVHQDSSGYSYTYYSENVLPGGGLDIPGRHVNDEGYVVDGDGNICIASDDLEKGTVVSVPFGDGIAVVYDCGSGYGNLDVYVSW